MHVKRGERPFRDGNHPGEPKPGIRRLWHLPVAFISLGILTIPYLVAVDTALGFFLVTSWRRTGTIAAPGIARAVSDELRNVIAVL